MSRRFHRVTSALLALAAALTLVDPALAGSRKEVKQASGRNPTTKAEKPANTKQASAAKPEPKGKAPPKGPAPALQKPVAKGKTPAAQATRGALEKTKPASKQAPPAKQPGDAKRSRGPVSHPTAAKSARVSGGDERSRVVEPALKPPGDARPMVRSVTSRLVVPSRAVAEQAAAFHYANLDDADAIAELNRRGIGWVPASPPLPGVRTPIRLTGPIRGVKIHSTLPEAERKTSSFEILDARLALALDDFCALLARHDVVELVHYTMYRPPGELPPDLNKQIRHPAGLAIDVGAVRKADGRWLAIGPHWPSDIGAKTCGEGAREHWSRPGREIVSIACEAADLRMFHFILTPHFDAAHADHLHLEIKPDTRWFLVN